VKKKLALAAAVTAFMGLLLLLYYNYKVVNRNTVEQMITEKKTINVLIAGANRFSDDRFSFFAIVSLNPENSNVGVTFIPPSFRIALDDDGSRAARIDELEFSSYNKILVQATLRRTLRLHVPFFVEVYPPDVKKIVDLLEGIDLFVLDQVKDRQRLRFGVNYFDGDRIVAYINTVEGNSIYLKFDRIADVLSTLYYNKQKYRRFVVPEMITPMFRSVKTNLLPQELMKIGEILYSDGLFFSTMLPGGLEGKYYVTDDIAYKIYESEFLRDLVLDDPTEPVTKIRILNGTDESGLARKMRNHLIREGLNVVEFGTFSTQKMAESIIISRKGEYPAVKKVSELLGIQRIYHIADNTQLDNVLIIIGEDYKSDRRK
jgi:anionic cell wall polymer biosynthesis LytR-Cps2A-Psr (LCP) family protein